MCRVIGNKKGKYFFVVKANQKVRRKAIEDYFRINEKESITTIDADHGRIETRELWVLKTPKHIDYWPECEYICKIKRRRYNKGKGKETEEIAYAITRVEGDHAKPENLLKIRRGHWTIENQLHWIKDNEFNEDRSIVRKGHGPQLFSFIRNKSIEILSRSKKRLKYFREDLTRFPKRCIKLLQEN